MPHSILRRRVALGLQQLLVGLGVSFVLGNIYAAHQLRNLQQSAYRAHDQFTRGKRYEPGIDVFGVSQFGDLCATSGAQGAEECPFWGGKRRYRFVTDVRGWKTLQPLESADMVIAGDSFLAALGGDDMVDQLGWQLKGLTGLGYYEAAHPGDPGDYLHRLLEIDKERPLGRRYILLVYEGNDLAIKDRSASIAVDPMPPDERPLLRLWRDLLDNKLPRLLNPPLTRLLAIYIESYRLRQNRHTHTAFDASDIHAIRGVPVAFSVNNRLVSRDAGLSLPRSLDPSNLGYLRDKIKCLVLVPTKYSVYLDNRPLQRRHPLLWADFQRLRQSGIEVMDLTPSLKRAAKAEGAPLLYWPDDTHWNKYGIRVAAHAMAADPACSRPK